MTFLKTKLGALAASPRLAQWVAGAFALVLMLGMLVPVYSDEIGWRLQERAGLDGVDKLYSEQCGPTTLARPLWFMWPVRWYSALFNTAFPDPFWVRASGVAYALLWAGMLLALIGQMARDAARKRSVTTLTLGLLGLGTLPLQLVWSRPEQPILLALMGAVLLAFAGRDKASWWRPAAAVLLAGVALSYHFKALVLIPVFALCLQAGDHRRASRIWRLLCLIGLAAITIPAANYWFARLSCPGDALLAAQHDAQSLHYEPGSGLFGLFLHVLTNANLPIYVTRAAPDVTPMSHWLPYHLISKPEQVIWSVVMIALWFFSFLLAGGALRRSFRQQGRAALSDLRVLLALLLFAVTLAYGAMQIVRNSYEAAFVLPLLALSFACALCASPTPSPRLRAMASLCGIAMLGSMALIAAIYGPSLVQASKAAGYLPDQPLSVPVFHYARARETITKAAALCRISPDNHHQRLLLDDATYFAFMRTRLPDHQLSVLEPKWRGAITDPLAYLQSQKMQGLVVHCRFLDPRLRAMAKESGGVCCIGL